MNLTRLNSSILSFSHSFRQLKTPDGGISGIFYWLGIFLAFLSWTSSESSLLAAESEAEAEADSIPYFSIDSESNFNDDDSEKDVPELTRELTELLAEPLDPNENLKKNKINKKNKQIKKNTQEDKKADSSPPLPPGVRRSFFQGISAETNSVTDFGGSESFSLMEGKAGLKTGLPLPWIQSMMGISTNFDAVYLAKTPEKSRLPDMLYRTGANLLIYRPLNEDWTLAAGTGISAASDFKTSPSGEGIQIPLFLTAQWKASPQWQWLFGAAYTDSADWKFVPFVGFTWLPNEDWKVEMTMPRPKVSHRMTLPFFEQTFWGYAAGEYGGGSWKIERAWIDGQTQEETDLLKYRDVRFMLGLEPASEGASKFSWSAETGVSFGRKIYFDGSGDIYRPQPGLVSRLKISF